MHTPPRKCQACSVCGCLCRVAGGVPKCGKGGAASFYGILLCMQLFSPAKVNLSLAVSDVRADGYHDLDSVVTLVTLGDDVFLERRREGVSLEMICEGVEAAGLPGDVERNLAVRAVRLLERATGRQLPTAIRIVKRIPLGGGLGGGSSNAATVLKGVNALWELGLPPERLCVLGAELGSDVPLFLLDGTVRMRGRGERVERLAMTGAPSMWLVLVNDGTHCPTPQVYRALDALRIPPEARHEEKAQLPVGCAEKDLTARGDLCDTLHLFLRKGDVRNVARWVQNDLETPCFQQFPEVGAVAGRLKAAGCEGVLLCGSGATVCGFVGSREEGERVLAHPALAECRRAIVQTLPDGVMAAHGPLTPIVMVRIHVGQPVCPCV